MLKYFDRDQFARYDAHAKEVARQFWLKHGYNCIENPDEYGVDLRCTVRVESPDLTLKQKKGGMALSSIIRPFPFPSERIKFTEDHVTFFVLNQGRTDAAVVNGKHLLKSPEVKVKNKMVPLGDYFFEITLSDVQFINLLAS